MDVLVMLIPDPDTPGDERERLMRRMRAELAELDIDSVRTLPGRVAPDGAKGVDADSVGAIIVAMSVSGGVITSVIETLRDLLERHAARHRMSVTINGDSIELERATADQQCDLVRAYVHRHTNV